MKKRYDTDGLSDIPEIAETADMIRFLKHSFICYEVPRHFVESELVRIHKVPRDFVEMKLDDWCRERKEKWGNDGQQ